MKFLKFFLISLCFLYGSLQVNAQTITKSLYPVDDTYIFANGGAENNVIRHLVSPNFLKSYSHHSDDRWSYKTYLKFDLSNVINNPDLIKNVSLKLYGKEDQGSFEHHISLYLLSSNDWTEDELSYNTRSTSGAAEKVLTVTQTIGTNFKLVEFDVTTLIKNAKATGVNRISMMLADDTNVRNPQNSLGSIISFYSKEAAGSNKPSLVVQENDVSQLKLTEVKLNDELLDDFSPDKYNYVVGIEPTWSVVPVISFQQSDPDAEVLVRDAKNLTGPEEERTTLIQVSKGGVSITYRVTFAELPTSAFLSSILIDGEELEFFNKDRFLYTFNLPYNYVNIPKVTYKGERGQHVEMKNVVNISSESEDERTAYIKIASRDSSEFSEYKIKFNILPELDLFLCIGQSNMAGRGYMDVKLGDDELLENAYLFTPNNRFENAGNPMNKYSSIRRELNMQQVSPAWGFAKYMNDYHPEIKTGYIVNARGGSGIEEWLKGEELYVSTVERTKNAMKWGNLKGIIWHQGESNSASSKVTAYPEQLKSLVQNLRYELDVPNLYFIAGELIYTYSTTFNMMIRTISSFIDHADWVSAENLKPRAEGDVHFDREGNITLGERYAQKMLNKVYGITAVEATKMNENLQISVDGNVVSITNLNADCNLSMYDLFGKVVLTQSVDNHCSIVVPEKGVFILKIHSAKSHFFRKVLLH